MNLGRFTALLPTTTMVFAILSSFHLAHAQYFASPIDSPLYLSGNFAQLRDGHFHYGIDLPTNNTEGWTVRAVADGYVSRIFIASYGYGKALFVTHPNGLTTVYAHLSGFNQEIAAYTLNQHYTRKSNSLDIFPAKNKLKVRRGQLIAFSGNSGGSSGPHLHFEVRNGSNEVLNPQVYFQLPDTIPPSVGQVRLLHNRLHAAEDFQPAGFVQGDTVIFPPGNIYVEAELYDRMILEQHKLAPSRYALFINGEKCFEARFEKYAFSENKYANLHLDYDAWWLTGKRFQKCYTEPGNRLRFYHKNLNNPVINLQKGELYRLELEVTDARGLVGSKQFWLMCNDSLVRPADSGNAMPTASRIAPNTPQVLASADSLAQLHIPAGCFYEFTDVGVTHSPALGNSCSMVEITREHNSKQPFLQSPELWLSYKPTALSPPLSKLLIAYVGSEGKLTSMGGKFMKNGIMVSISLPGKYCVTVDTVAPVIAKDAIVSDKLVFRVTDNFSGIGYYQASIDGKFALLNFDAKKGTITFAKDKFTPPGRHLFNLVVGDRRHNYTRWEGVVDF